MNQHHESKGGHASTGNPYARLAIMAVASFAAMYALMYAMVDRFANVFPNLNQAYMAGLMAAPMVIIELLVMWSMYPNRKLNAGLMAASVVLLGLCWFSIRAQAAITDREFLKSMIPHHGGAILMCQETTLRDPELEQLCKGIVTSQQQEIDFMKNKLQQTASH